MVLISGYYGRRGKKSFSETFFFPFKGKKTTTTAPRSCTNQDIEDYLLVLALQYRKQFAYYVCFVFL